VQSECFLNFRFLDLLMMTFMFVPTFALGFGKGSVLIQSELFVVRFLCLVDGSMLGLSFVGF
jgi:hypothetical protein